MQVTPAIVLTQDNRKELQQHRNCEHIVHRLGAYTCRILISTGTIVQRHSLRQHALDTRHDKIKAHGGPFHVSYVTPDTARLVHALNPATTMSTSAIISVKPSVSVSRCSYYRACLAAVSTACMAAYSSLLAWLLPSQLACLAAAKSTCYTHAAQGLDPSGD